MNELRSLSPAPCEEIAPEAGEHQQPGASPKEKEAPRPSPTGEAARSKCWLAGKCSLLLTGLRGSKQLDYDLWSTRGPRASTRAAPRKGQLRCWCWSRLANPECRVEREARGLCTLHQASDSTVLAREKGHFCEQWDTKLPCRWVYIESVAREELRETVSPSLQVQNAPNLREGLRCHPAVGRGSDLVLYESRSAGLGLGLFEKG